MQLLGAFANPDPLVQEQRLLCKGLVLQRLGNTSGLPSPKQAATNKSTKKTNPGPYTYYIIKYSRRKYQVNRFMLNLLALKPQTNLSLLNINIYFETICLQRRIESCQSLERLRLRTYYLAIPNAMMNNVPLIAWQCANGHNERKPRRSLQAPTKGIACQDLVRAQVPH